MFYRLTGQSPAIHSDPSNRAQTIPVVSGSDEPLTIKDAEIVTLGLQDETCFS